MKKATSHWGGLFYVQAAVDKGSQEERIWVSRPDRRKASDAFLERKRYEGRYGQLRPKEEKGPRQFLRLR